MSVKNERWSIPWNRKQNPIKNEHDNLERKEQQLNIKMK